MEAFIKFFFATKHPILKSLSYIVPVRNANQSIYALLSPMRPFLKVATRIFI